MEVEERIGGKVEVEKVVHQLLFGDWKEVIKARRKDLPELLHRYSADAETNYDDQLTSWQLILDALRAGRLSQEGGRERK